jgi:hypothetical protein
MRANQRRWIATNRLNQLQAHNDHADLAGQTPPPQTPLGLLTLRLNVYYGVVEMFLACAGVRE